MLCSCCYSRLLITRTFKGNRKKVWVIGSSKKIAESKVKKSFYCTVNILIKFNYRNVKWKLKDSLDYKSERNAHGTKHSLNRECVVLFWEEKLLHVSLWQSTLASTSKRYPYNMSIGNPNSMFRTPVDGFFPDYLRAQNMVRVINSKII